MAIAESHHDVLEVDDAVLLVLALVVTLQKPNGQLQEQAELILVKV